MEQTTVVHNTFVVERRYQAGPERVFAAFQDAGKKRRWYGDGEQSAVEEYELDFRVGGRERVVSRFKAGSPVAGMRLENVNDYREIVPERRIIFTSAMALDGRTFSVSLGTVELEGTEGGTELRLTFQSVFLEGADGPQMREEGWRKLLERLDLVA